MISRDTVSSPLLVSNHKKFLPVAVLNSDGGVLNSDQSLPAGFR
jgi:hypothetical protein